MRASLLIDGRSGSGKTELARAIVVDWPGAQLLRMDDLYPGWHGLAAGGRYLVEVLGAGRWQRWDWATGARAEWHELDPDRPLIVEGVGCLTRATRAEADTAVWVETDEALRRQRALARDPYFAAYWDDWAAQERAFLASERPASLADAVLDGIDVHRHIVTKAASQFWS
jgi:hypothetical protein